MANLLAGIGQAQPVSQLIDTYGRYQAQQSQLETMAMQRKMLEAKMAEQERLSRPVLLSELVGRGSDKGKPNIMKVFAEAAKPFAKKIQIPGGGEDYAITQADLPQVQKFMDMQKDFHPQLQWATYQDNQLRIQNAEKERAKLKTGAEQIAFDDELEKIKNENAAILKEFGKEGKTSEPFTLSPGQQRFGPDGKPIASVEPKPEKIWGEPTKMVIDGKTVMVQTSNTGEMKTVAQGASPAVTINFDKDVVKQTIKELPKLKEAARTAKSGIDRIDKMLGLIEKGAGGRIGQAKAWLNPTLEALGIKNQGYSDAQLYQILARTLGGSMRMEIIGPGQVSDYENRLMAAVSGGGGTGTEAAKELLMYYRGVAEGKINDYNNAASSVGEVSPAAKRSYKPVAPTEPPEKKRYKFNPATGQLE